MPEAMVKFYPIISCIQKIALYETKSNFYLVGSNNTQSRFKVIKIDRMQPKELHIYDDKVEYTAHEIQNLVNMIYAGNRQRAPGVGTSKVVSAFGIVGFIKFLEGYYIILITKRTKVAVVGMHSIYKIEDTHMIYIPHESIRETHPEELRYFKMFQNIDLASNFYFSYSYDLTHSLQHNLTVPKQFKSNKTDYNPDFKVPSDASKLYTTSLIQPTDEIQNFGIRTQPNRKFVWNNHLLREVETELHPDWLLYITHGFIGQSNISIFGRAIYVTLIARRSCRYAGTRFLKRGANFQGDVANEVETEQMVFDSGVSSFTQGHYTSFIQMRGSIPGHWKQDMGKMVAKPAITIDLNDPFSETAGAHFNELFQRYGTPIIVLNLVKQRERKPQESLLSEILSNAIKYLNQFLYVEHQIVYKTFDMARKNKGTANVMQNLADIAKNAVMKTGIFYNHRKFYAQKSNTVVGQFHSDLFSLQTGIIRTNCVDCLDRTNTAQFAIGKCVLGYQLCALGALDSPTLEFDTDCVRMLECLYEDHGDTLALQYGGSQLVHRIKTYRKTAPWTSQGNDIMQTLSRYYSNTFSDAEKQNAINLFLGLFIPKENGRHIWELVSDIYLHHKVSIYSNKSLTQWWNEDVVKCLPLAYNDLTKSCYEIIQIPSKDIEMVDAYTDYHRPHELSNLSDVFSFTINNSIRDFMPNFTTDCSPFSIRVRPVRRREELISKGGLMKNPSVTGHSSTSSTGSTGSSTSSSAEESCLDDESIHTNDTLATSKISDSKPITFKSLFPTMKEVYGTELKQPNADDILTYKKYAFIRKASGNMIRSFTSVSSNMRPTKFSSDTSISIKPPTVDKKSIETYKGYVSLGVKGANIPKKNDINIYRKYAL